MVRRDSFSCCWTSVCRCVWRACSPLPYLIFVIFFTQTRFLENKIYTEERVNYEKRISRQNSVNQDLLDQVNNKDQDHEKKGRFGFSSLSLSNYTMCVKFHTVCKSTLGLCKNKKFTHKSSNYTLCVKLHIECKSTFGLCKNKKYTHITPKSLSNYTLCVKAV